MIFDQNLLTSAGIVAGFTALGAFWSQAKGFARYLTGIFSLQKELDYKLSHAVYKYLRVHYRKLPSGISVYNGVYLTVDRKPILSVVPFDMPNPQVSVWWGKRGLFISYNKATKLFGIRGLFDPRGLVSDALDYAERDASDEGVNNFRVITIIGSAGDLPGQDNRRRGSGISGGGEVGEKSSDIPSADPDADVTIGIDDSFMYSRDRYIFSKQKKDPLEGLYYQQDVLGLIEKLKHWYSLRDWYAERMIPWRTGALFHGPGGTGKSSLALVIAKILKIPIYQYYLNTLTDKEFMREWGSMQVPCVVALEDFDTVFNGREPTTIHQSLSFEAVLNQISGISAISGVLLIVTTNNIEKIDPALGRIDEHGRPTRPGRIDHIIHMGMTDREQRQKIAHHVLRDWPVLAEHLVDEGVDTTAAQFQSMCVQAAIEKITH